MKATIKGAIRKMELQLGQTLMLLKFRLVNLCVKSEPAALLAVSVPGDGAEELELEKVANVGVLDDDSMLIAPFADDDMKKIRLAVKKVHPEFKQHIETIDLDAALEEAGVNPDEETGKAEMPDIPETPVPSVVANDSERNILHVLVLTVPQVDDDRRKVLLDAVKVQIDACNVSMDITISKAKEEVAKYVVGLQETEVEEANSKLKEATKLYKDEVKQAEENKNKEIEEAYQRYLQKQEEGGDTPATASDKEKGDDEYEDGAFSMKFDD